MDLTFCSLFCYANESMWLLEIWIGPDKMGEDKMTKLANQVNADCKIKIDGFQQVLPLSVRQV